MAIGLDSSTVGSEYEGDISSRESFSDPLPHNADERSVVIGDGIRVPPDIGAAGTSSSTPPIRAESPTDEPDVLPSSTLVAPDPSDPANPSSGKAPPPLGQPDFLKE